MKPARSLHRTPRDPRLGVLFRKYGHAQRRRCARPARRDEWEFRDYLSEEQRIRTGCSGDECERIHKVNQEGSRPLRC